MSSCHRPFGKSVVDSILKVSILSGRATYTFLYRNPVLVFARHDFGKMCSVLTKHITADRPTMTSTAARSAATVARRATDCGRDSRMARRAPCTHRAVGRPRSGAQRCIALLCAVCVATALTDHGCQRLLPWTASPNALKTFVPSISNRTDKSLA